MWAQPTTSVMGLDKLRGSGTRASGEVLPSPSIAAISKTAGPPSDAIEERGECGVHVQKWLGSTNQMPVVLRLRVAWTNQLDSCPGVWPVPDG